MICVRKSSDGLNYHFMKMKDNFYSYVTWTHKPDRSEPLQWNYYSPGADVWTNEGVVNGAVQPATLTYDSEIYYIVYKSKTAPGTQPTDYMPLEKLKEYLVPDEL